MVIDLIERVEQEVADQAARRAHFASQIASEMEAQVVEHEMRRCVHECLIIVHSSSVSSPLERTNLSVGLDAAELSFCDAFWPIVQEVAHTVLFDDQSRRKRADDAEIMSTKTHGAMKRAREARVARAATPDASEA